MNLSNIRKRSRQGTRPIIGTALIGLTTAAFVSLAIYFVMGRNVNFAMLAAIAFLFLVIGLALGVILAAAFMNKAIRAFAENKVGLTSPYRRNLAPGPPRAASTAEIHDHTTLSRKPPRDRPAYSKKN